MFILLNGSWRDFGLPINEGQPQEGPVKKCCKSFHYKVDFQTSELMPSLKFFSPLCSYVTMVRSDPKLPALCSI
jgi:hypothetical protein